MDTIAPIIAQLAMHTRLFHNVTTGFTEDDAGRLMAGANHVKWLTGHLVSARFMTARLVGLTDPEPFPALFADLKGRQDGAVYPTMAELTRDWPPISERLLHRLAHLSAAELASPPPFRTPTDDGTLKGFLAFVAHHEAYTIGQIGYVRRMVGLAGMAYT